MTYPPQQPGPYGQQPPPGPYGQQPDPFAGQPAYQGFGGYPGGGQPPLPPKPNNTGKIIAIVAIALIVLVGAGVGVYFLTKGDDKGTTAAPSGTSESKKPPTSESSDNDGPTKTSEKPSAGSGDPQKIVDAYIKAYTKKDFSSVTAEACEAYKKKYGTDTSELESKLSKYTVTGKAKGDPVVKGSTATAEIDLELTPEGGTPQPAHIRIKIVKESGVWRFCGEETA
ncbi:hypothetical protein [Alloactinosynnema sp. L-07]|uniref:hypothetical protein n=1 Tax=Alloactinosynnema sp. L-07 TaxID=1653480 RepID=UPI00065F00B8|nr:hypothetical protein [Alloactinosynnema sp. L-07]CRK56417.1 hypothetical protein [Alloactinosynnema sp. L-07]